MAAARSGRTSCDTAPNTPPCILTILTAAAWLPASVAAQQSSSSTHSKPRSLASRMVVCTHTSVVMPVSTMLRMPLVCSSSSRSVAQNEPLPGLSMIGSPGAGASSGMISQPGSPRTRMLPHGPGIADAGADLARAPALVGGQVGEIGAVALARVDDVIALGAHGGEQAPGSARSARASARCRSPSCRRSRRRRRSRSACR